MKQKIFFSIGLLFIATLIFAQKADVGDKEKTIFQTSSPWKPVTDVRSDVAVVYGTALQDLKSYGIPDDKQLLTFEQRVQSWRDRGYITHFMTGIAWGDYQDYFTGKWDGKPHMDEGQVSMNGDTIWHGPMVPYVVPSKTFLGYMKEKHIKRAIDAGIDAIYMEEPEFWMRAGYSDAFKREWENYYGFNWRPQHESPENTYLSNKLKYYLYYRALEEVFTYAKEYGKSKGLNVRCYVPTHSLPSYSSIGIVSPEAALASLPCVDGYIAQVWTGTARVPTFFNGIRKEHVFENAFLEYGSMESMTRPTGRKMFFLTDPVEDAPRDWADYKKNYQATFTAQLLYPMIADYEVMPWPDRIYEGLYKTCEECDTKEKIPLFYSTQMQVMINTLNDMPLSENKVSGSNGIGVLMSNSMMFQRFPTHAGYDDPDFSNFYGQTLPLLKRGIPVSIVHIENTGFPETWKDIKVLVMSYSNMKPMKSEYHYHIAQWVKNGGILVYCGEDSDPFQSVQEWWNKEKNKYNVPSDHLFEQMNIRHNPKEGEYMYGKGTVYIIRKDPKILVMHEGMDKELVNIVKILYEQKAKAGTLEIKNSFYLRRGNYSIIAVLDESISEEPYVMKGLFIDLFDPELPVLQEKTVSPGEQAFLYDINTVSEKNKPQVLASACRVYDEKTGEKYYSFITKSPKDTNNAMRILLPGKYSSCKISNSKNKFLQNVKHTWDEKSKTCALYFENDPDGVNVTLEW
jgi:hypothetical protein